MKVVILCGGQGSRIRDVSDVIPKPMLPIGRHPILWHIMKLYSHYGYHDFILCLGYKGWEIKDFFLNYYARTSDITVKLNKENATIYHSKSDEAKWSVTLVDTGDTTQTGTRVKRIEPYLEGEDKFALTYGDGVGDINIAELVKQHEKSGVLLTVTGVHPSGRFGEIEVEKGLVNEFNEKPNVGSGMINGGFMVCQKTILAKYFSSSKDEILEKDIIPQIVKDKQVALYKHNGYWQCMDTAREYNQLNELWDTEKAPWRLWP